MKRTSITASAHALPASVSLGSLRACALALLCAWNAASRPAAQTETFAARLQGSQVVPPVTTSASGTGTIVLDTSSGLVTINGSYGNLGSVLQIAALHGPAPVGTPGTHIFNLTFNGSTTGTFSGSTVLSPAQVQDLLSGLHYIDLHTVQWTGGELRGQVWPLAAVASRHAGSNPASFTANAPVLGGTWTASVDLSITGHSLAVVFGFDGAVDLALGGGQRLLCLDTFGSGELLNLTPQPGDLVIFNVPVPDLPSLAGMTACTQALHFGGIVPYALSNAQDLTIGL